MADVFRVSTRGAGRVASRFRRAERELQAIMREEIVRLGSEATDILREHAPKGAVDRPGAITVEQGITATPLVRGGRITVTIRSGARSEDGFDYTRVTRFGHRAARTYIFPKTSRVLRVELPSRTVFRGRVRAYHPAGDWVDESRPEIEQEVTETQQRIGRSIQTRLLR